jgi:CheY-like chemotaxis protein
MDIQMPGMSGYEATRELHKLAPGLPVVGQTAHAMVEERIKCQEAGMVDLVVKPIDLNVLVQTIQRRARPRTA